MNRYIKYSTGYYIYRDGDEVHVPHGVYGKQHMFIRSGDMHYMTKAVHYTDLVSMLIDERCVFSVLNTDKIQYEQCSELMFTGNRIVHDKHDIKELFCYTENRELQLDYSREGDVFECIAYSKEMGFVCSNHEEWHIAKDDIVMHGIPVLNDDENFNRTLMGFDNDKVFAMVDFTRTSIKEFGLHYSTAVLKELL